MLTSPHQQQNCVTVIRKVTSLLPGMVWGSSHSANGTAADTSMNNGEPELDVHDLHGGSPACSDEVWRSPSFPIRTAHVPTPCCSRTPTVEVCLKSNSNANPAEIKALVERYAQAAAVQQAVATRVAGQPCLLSSALHSCHDNKSFVHVQVHGPHQCEADG